MPSFDGNKFVSIHHLQRYHAKRPGEGHMNCPIDDLSCCRDLAKNFGVGGGDGVVKI